MRTRSSLQTECLAMLKPSANERSIRGLCHPRGQTVDVVDIINAVYAVTAVYAVIVVDVVNVKVVYTYAVIGPGRDSDAISLE